MATLIVTEKPSSAQKIAFALSEGEIKKKNNYGVAYYEITRSGQSLIVAPAVGHLFVLDQKAKSKKWEYPVFDMEWKPAYENRGSEWSKKYFQNLKKLARKADSFISACDYDIEGSVIAWNIINFICKSTDGKRMKFSTLTKHDLEKAYDKASEHLDFSQIEAGLARHNLDFLWGINTSRALTLALKQAGNFKVLSTGRVQGPTLNILSKRQKEIDEFIPEPYWELEMNGSVSGSGFIASHAKGKFWKKPEADEIFSRCKEKDGTVGAVVRKEYRQNPPFPFDLTTLQRESYKNFGYSPKQTLDISQTLYEQALISYPRTASQKLPVEIGYRKIMESLRKQKAYSGLCKKVLEKQLKPNEGPKKDPAHPSIFPTGSMPKELNNYQRKIYDLIVKRFISVFAKPAVREKVKAEILVEGERFITEGYRTLEANWIDFYKPYAKFKELILPQLNEGDAVKNESLELLDKKTEPPSRYTQATVLRDMEKLGLGTKCLTGDCKITSPDCKETYLSEMWKKSVHICHEDNTEIRKLNTPSVTSLNHDLNNVEFSKPMLISRRRMRRNEKLIRITAKGGDIKVTEDHPVYVYDEGVGLKEAKKIRKGDKIVSILSRNETGNILIEESQFHKGKNKLQGNMYVNKFSSKKSLGIRKDKLPIRWSSDLAWILGYFYGDGSYNPPSYNGSHQVYFTVAERKVLSILKTRLSRVFGTEPRVYSVKNNTQYKVQCNSFVASAIAETFPSMKRKGKLAIPKKFIGDFLRGLFDADGNVHLRHIGKFHIKGKEAMGHGVPRVKITLAKKHHIEWINELLHSLGIKTTVKKGKAKCREKYFKCFTILIGGRDKVDTFAYKIGFDVEHKRKILYKGLLSDSPKYKRLKVCYDIVTVLKGCALDRNQLENTTKYSTHEITEALKRLVKMRVLKRTRLSPHNNPPNNAVYELVGKEYIIHALRACSEHIEDDLYATEILKTENIRPKEPFVYDISVSESSPNFMANGLFLVHNSTRASIIQTLYDRGYIDDKSIVVTELGMAVINALEKSSPDIISTELTRKFEQEVESIQEGKRDKEEVIAEARESLGKILDEFKKKEESIGKVLQYGLKDTLRRENEIGPCKCGGTLVKRRSRAGKRFVGCSSYPECTETFSLPHKGFIKPLSDKCSCGLFILSVKYAGRRPWKLCVRCGFVNKIKKPPEKTRKKSKRKSAKKTGKNGRKKGN